MHIVTGLTFSAPVTSSFPSWEEGIAVPADHFPNQVKRAYDGINSVKVRAE